MIYRVILFVSLVLWTHAPLARADALFGPASGQPAYTASFGAVTCNQVNVLAIESGANVGFSLVGWCVNISQATAAAAVNVTVRREVTASTGGTVLAIEGTGAAAISKMYPSDPNYPGLANGGAATAGAVGATLDQVGFSIGEIGAGLADPTATNPFCKWYGLAGEKLPTVTKGVLNGIAISMSSSGGGGLASCAITATIVTR